MKIPASAKNAKERWRGERKMYDIATAQHSNGRGESDGWHGGGEVREEVCE
jgi:hypothetical protein